MQVMLRKDMNRCAIPDILVGQTPLIFGEDAMWQCLHKFY